MKNFVYIFIIYIFKTSLRIYLEMQTTMKILFPLTVPYNLIYTSAEIVNNYSIVFARTRINSKELVYCS